VADVEHIPEVDERISPIPFVMVIGFPIIYPGFPDFCCVDVVKLI
jgi:hypothetical protein